MLNDLLYVKFEVLLKSDQNLHVGICLIVCNVTLLIYFVFTILQTLFILLQKHFKGDSLQQALGELNTDAIRLHPFEKGAIGNLLPESVEEARALIPSLNNSVQGIRDDEVDDESLEELLSQLNLYRQQE